jgi:leader peptidase (prepilin peptidase) / N-methyltransferase
MAWLVFIPVAWWCLCVFLLGLMVGSFLNVLIARLPYEKSIIWPSSRCFSCYRPIRLFDNVPILGYLRLRGRCRFCGAKFSSRYLWVELGTGLAFLGLFVAEVVLNIYRIPALNFNVLAGNNPLPPWQGLALFAYHAFLLSALIAAAAIDVEHRLIPPLIPYTGMVVGIIGGALMPWPWPNPATAGTLPVPAHLKPDAPWSLSEFWGKIPLGAQLWPFWGPTFQFAPPGSIQLGLMNGIIGALAGSLVVRIVRWLFSTTFGREALGMGDADLMMMAGAFLGWQVAVLALFFGAVMALVLHVVGLILGGESVHPTGGNAGEKTSGPGDGKGEPVAEGQPAPNPRELPFGPGLALGIVVTWLAWPWLAASVQFVFFDRIIFGLMVLLMCVGLLAAGLLLRKSGKEPAEAKV